MIRLSTYAGVGGAFSCVRDSYTPEVGGGCANATEFVEVTGSSATGFLIGRLAFKAGAGCTRRPRPFAAARGPRRFSTYSPPRERDITLGPPAPWAALALTGSI